MVAVIERRSGVQRWALFATGASSAFTIGISIWLINLLSGRDWCGQALGAAKYATGRPEYAVSACFGLMNKQVDALAKALLISSGTQALCLLVLVVIVLANGRFSANASKDGGSLNIGRDEAANAVADAAEQKADEITRDGER